VATKFDWAAATACLTRISRIQVGRFLVLPEADDVYGMGFFCNASHGNVSLVANTEQHHQRGLRQSRADRRTTNPKVFRWDTGNWKYPGGLFPSRSAEQTEFDAAWKEYRELLSRIDHNMTQERLEEVCVDVLLQLFQEGAFVAGTSLKGFIVLSPYDFGRCLLDKRIPLSRFP